MRGSRSSSSHYCWSFAFDLRVEGKRRQVEEHVAQGEALYKRVWGCTFQGWYVVLVVVVVCVGGWWVERNDSECQRLGDVKQHFLFQFWMLRSSLGSKQPLVSAESDALFEVVWDTHIHTLLNYCRCSCICIKIPFCHFVIKCAVMPLWVNICHHRRRYR